MLSLRRKVLARSATAVFFILFNSPAGFSESAANAAAVQQTPRPIQISNPTPMGVGDGLEVKGAQVLGEAPSQETESVPAPPHRLSMDRLRRENFRYPDHGLIGRFIELSTECPPLLESDG